VCLTCVDGHIFSHSMITHEPFVRFDGFLDSLSCGLGRVRGHVFRASLLVHDFVLVIFFFGSSYVGPLRASHCFVLIITPTLFFELISHGMLLMGTQ
jgi:hypothetical protein